MIDVGFISETPTEIENVLRFSVIVSRFCGRWVFCRHKTRDTYEVPGGHIEQGETAEQAAKRELFEETGALEYTLHRVGSYSVEKDGVKDYGALFFAEISRFGDLPEDFEMQRVEFFDTMPDNLTYPLIQPKLVEWVKNLYEL